MTHIRNVELTLEAVPDPAAGNDDELVTFANDFAGYDVWGEPLLVQRIMSEVAGTRRDGATPESLTILRTALFAEARAERFVDFGGFSDSMEGWQEHRRYMWGLVTAIRALLKAPRAEEDEGEFALRWLAETKPLTRAADAFPVSSITHESLAGAVALTSRFLARDLAAGERITEARMRQRFVQALGHLTEGWIEVERHVAIPQFRGVGPVDVIVRITEQGETLALIECKWSTNLRRDKIYEGAWDAVKLALATSSTNTAEAFLVTGAPDESWKASETDDLFDDSTIDTRELWTRPLNPPGLNGGDTVGSDCEAGGRGNIFTQAPEQLVITRVAESNIPDASITIKASAVHGTERMIAFAPEPEFPLPITQRWLDETVPTMPEDTFKRLLAWLGHKRWTQDDLERRVYGLRPK